MADRKIGENYLQALIENREQVNIFLRNGVKMMGIITFENKNWVLVKEPSKSREALVFKDFISTIYPKGSSTEQQFDTEGDHYISNLIENHASVKIFVANGFQFCGIIVFDNNNEYFLVEDKNHVVSIVYQKNISTIFPEI